MDRIFAELDALPTIIAKYIKAEEVLSETHDINTLTAIEKYIDDLRVYQVNLLMAIKNGEEFAFDELIQTKDIRNFIYHYSWHIFKFYNFQYREEDIIHEIKHQIFHTIKVNYRIYNKPNELSLLINSMRRWIKQKVGSELTEVYRPKVDDSLAAILIEDESHDASVSWVRETAQKLLDNEDLQIFELRFLQGLGYKEIGIEMNKSKDAMQRRYKKILRQLKAHLEVKREWQN